MSFGTVGLQTHIWNNNVRSVALIALYPFIFTALVWAVCTVWGTMVEHHAHNYDSRYQQYEDGTYYEESYIGQPDNPKSDRPAGTSFEAGQKFANSVIYKYWPVIGIIITLWFMIAYFFQTRMIRMLSHAHPVNRAQEPELYNLLENLCITAGVKMPKLEIIETHARNAFASGIDDNSYTVTVTRGLLQSLDKDEVEAVLAHELTHIINRDVRLLIISTIFIGMIGFASQLAWNSIRYSAFTRGKKDGRVVLAILAVAVILWIGYLATVFTRFALSRRREFLADAGAVELTKNPDAMMSALLRISGKASIPQASDDIAMMCIENKNKFMGLFMTHPPIEKRIKAISETTGAPIPEIQPGRRTDDEQRFLKPDHENPPSWATLATKKGNKNPWR